MFRLFRSAAFRLTLFYMVTFGASVTGLLILVYVAIIGDMEQDLKHSIDIQMSDLRKINAMSGINETIASVKSLIAKDDDKSLVLMLIDSNWKVVAGNVEVWPGGRTHTPTWIKFQIGRAHGVAPPPKAIAMNTALPGGYILLVGRTMKHIEHVHELIVDVLYICFGIMFVLAAVGGLLLSYTIYRRVDTVNEAFRRVAGGDLTTRVKVTGMGDEFDHLSVHLNRTLARISELMEGMRDMSVGVAHDLRTPLNRLRHRLESLASSAAKPADVKEQVRVCLAEIDSLVGTFNAILRIAQAEMGARPEQFESFDLSAAVADIVDLYRPVAEEKGDTLTAEIAEGVAFYGDRHLLAQTVANLLDNAIKYTPRGGAISVMLATEGARIVLRVCDSGPGIPEEFRAKVLEKFFRLEASRSSPGNGLGLSLVGASVKLHKGDLSFAGNHPGLRVTIRLPRRVTDATAAGA